ncbi:calcium-activated chloride channel [Nitzschia inconspicua]|uniref:Calcium-activated chloride channel n=1 Tax=Nitzschia inconspicua TaxID=303405 RepID=A0A9K3L048_9STRA|nr:calcium-activated chloride channel [Nitzschia inconspicua]
MTRTNHAGPASLMKGKLYHSTSGNGNWHVADTVSDEVGNVHKVNEKIVVATDVTHSASSAKMVRSDNGKQMIDFLKDDPSEMTLGRRIALSLIDKKWYNPRAGEDDTEEQTSADMEGTLRTTSDALENGATTPTRQKIDDFDAMMHNRKPSLAKAWAYFEHVALYRYLVPEDEKEKQKKSICVRAFRKFFCKGDKKLERAEPGESDDPTRLYSPFFTPHKQLGDFGLGLGLYFSTLRVITFITLIAGLISSYNVMYFASDMYLPQEYQEELPFLLRGSAICTKRTWVPCDNCECEVNGRSFGTFPPERCAREVNGTRTFILRNDCDGTPWQLGATNFASVIWLLLSTMALGYYLKRQEIQFDEDEQTAQDYSVLITNPPADAKDPDEWKKFFEDSCDGAHVTVCTIAVDNDFLVRTLVERRERLRTISNMQEPDSSMRMLDLAKVAAEEERKRSFWGRLIAMVAPGVPEHFSRVVALDAKVEGLAQLDYPVTNVFLTFETEKDQRHVLSSLSVGSAKANRNDVRAVKDPKHLFRGKYVLNVCEPDEPNTVRWQDLNAGAWQKFKETAFTTFCTLVAIVLVAVLVNLANDSSTVGAAFTIAIFNTLFPMFAKALCNFESHPSEGLKQTSLYFKIAAFRWVSTAVVISIITPFTNTLSHENGLVSQVYALFFADIVTTNALQLSDIMGHIKRHLLAPRAATQDAMNLNFQGTEYELAERYTDMTKILFLCLWYCSVFPGSFFLCAFSLGVKYYVDKFCLMRTWKKAPQLGTTISRFSRRYFFTIAIAVMAVISSYYWSGFPFDNICPNDSINSTYVDSVIVLPKNVSELRFAFNVTFTEEDVDYRFCNQNLMAIGSGPTFPFVPTMTTDTTDPSNWMTDDQVITTTYFGWAAVGILVIVIVKFVYGWLVMFLDQYRNSYSAVGDDQGIHYSDVTSRSAYIPQVFSGMFSYPLIACNTEKIDEELFDWTDPDRSFGYYDLSKDAAKLLADLHLEEIPGFSVVKHYPPEKSG